MTAARKLTAEQRAACVWSRPKLRLVKLTPAEPELVSPRVQWIVVALVWAAIGLVGVGRWMGLVP